MVAKKLSLIFLFLLSLFLLSSPLTRTSEANCTPTNLDGESGCFSKCPYGQADEYKCSTDHSPGDRYYYGHEFWYCQGFGLCGANDWSCDDPKDAKQLCGGNSCVGQTDCSIFTSTEDKTCCNAVNTGCASCLNKNNYCSPPEISGIDWQCVYNTPGCIDQVWNTGCRQFPSNTAPACKGSLPTGSYFPGQVVDVSGQTILQNVGDSKITETKVSIGGTYVNWNGILNPDPPTSCTQLQSTGIKTSGNFTKTPTISFNSSNQTFSKTNFDSVGSCNLDPYNTTGVSNCTYGASCQIGSSTQTNNASKIETKFSWLVPNADLSGFAEVSGKNNAGDCKFNSNYNISGLFCKNFGAGDGTLTINQQQYDGTSPLPRTTVRLTSTNPKSSYIVSSSCQNTDSCNNDTQGQQNGFPYSYNQNTGASTFTSYSYIDVGLADKMPDGVTKIVSWSGGTQMNRNNDLFNDNSDGTRLDSTTLGDTVTVYFIGSSISVYGYAYQSSQGGNAGEMSATIDDLSPVVDYKLSGSASKPCKFLNTTDTKNEYALICTLSLNVNNNKSGFHKLVLKNENGGTVRLDNFSVENAFAIPWTVTKKIPTNCNQQCTITGKVRNKYYDYYTDQGINNKTLTEDSCSNISLKIFGPGPANLVATSLTLDKATYSPGETATATFNVTNTGNSTVPANTLYGIFNNWPSGNNAPTPADASAQSSGFRNVNYTVKVNNVDTSTSIPPLGTATIAIDFSVPTTPGTFTAFALADSGGTVSETSEGDNAINKTADTTPVVATYIVTQGTYFQVRGGDLTSGTGKIQSGVPLTKYLIEN